MAQRLRPTGPPRRARHIHPRVGTRTKHSRRRGCRFRPSTTLGANGTCQVQIEFAPTQTGPATGQLAFTDGAGTPATASGQISAAQSVTITNSGDLPLQVTSIAASTNFQQSSSCLSGAAAHSTCSISVQFASTQTGSLTGTLTLTDVLAVRTVGLSGTGLPPASFTVVPASLTFTNQQPGVASPPQRLTITNSGGVAMANVGAAHPPERIPFP